MDAVLNLRKLRYAHWYAAREIAPMLRTSTIQSELPVPDTTGWTIHWPSSYAWEHTWKRLDPIRAALRKLVRVESSEFTQEWRSFGGFPLDGSDLERCGSPGEPRHAYDLCGEVIMVSTPRGQLVCALDFSDYTLVSGKVRDSSDIYFKFMCPQDHHEAVVPLGFGSSNPRMLAVARWLQSWHQPERNIDVLARFGGWTDATSLRGQVVHLLGQSSGMKIRGSIGIMPYPAYMQELRRAKICIDAPGQGPITPRLVEAMALGAVVVCRRPPIDFPEPLVANQHYAEMAHDGSDVVEVCKNLLTSPESRALIALNSERYFERNFTAAAIARRILQQVAKVEG